MLGELAFRQENHEAAERYLERAVLLEDGVAAFHELRGMNHLRLGRIEDARESLEAALEIDRTQAAARNALAWTFYASGNSQEAITRLRELDDQLRDRTLKGDTVRCDPLSEGNSWIGHPSDETFHDIILLQGLFRETRIPSHQLHSHDATLRLRASAVVASTMAGD